MKSKLYLIIIYLDMTSALSIKGQGISCVERITADGGSIRHCVPDYDINNFLHKSTCKYVKIEIYMFETLITKVHFL